jgi:hypothetical protein
MRALLLAGTPCHEAPRARALIVRTCMPNQYARISRPLRNLDPKTHLGTLPSECFSGLSGLYVAAVLRSHRFCCIDHPNSTLLAWSRAVFLPPLNGACASRVAEVEREQQLHGCDYWDPPDLSSGDVIDVVLIRLIALLNPVIKSPGDVNVRQGQWDFLCNEKVIAKLLMFSGTSVRFGCRWFVISMIQSQLILFLLEITKDISDLWVADGLILRNYLRLKLVRHDRHFSSESNSALDFNENLIRLFTCCLNKMMIMTQKWQGKSE